MYKQGSSVICVCVAESYMVDGELINVMHRLMSNQILHVVSVGEMEWKTSKLSHFFSASFLNIEVYANLV